MGSTPRKKKTRPWSVVREIPVWLHPKEEPIRSPNYRCNYDNQTDHILHQKNVICLIKCPWDWEYVGKNTMITELKDCRTQELHSESETHEGGEEAILQLKCDTFLQFKIFTLQALSPRGLNNQHFDMNHFYSKPRSEGNFFFALLYLRLMSASRCFGL